MERLVTIPATYDYRLVVLSVLIAIMASYSALEMAGRINAARGMARAVWLGGGALAMGGGIWAMHFTGMLAYRLPLRVYYHVPTVALSFFAAVAASLLALFIVSQSPMTFLRVAVGSVLIGSGIASMHYIGMAAMRLAAMHHYDRGLWLLSIMVAIGVAFAAVSLIYYFEKRNGNKKLGIGIAVLMGLAIPLMHYTGMAAVHFTPMATAPDLSHAVDLSAVAQSDIVLVALAVMGFALLASMVDRRIATLDSKLALSEYCYHCLFDSNPHPSFVFDVQTMMVLEVNQAAVKAFGFSDKEWQHLKVTALNESEDVTMFAGPAPVGKVRETQFCAKEGTLVDVELTSSPIMCKGKNAALLMASDIRERKRAQRERDMMEIQLRHAQKLESIGQLAAGIAHEINTPTQYIGDNVSFLEDAFSDLRQLMVEYDLLLAVAKHGSVPPEMAEAVSTAIEAVHAGYLMEEIPKAIQQTREGVGRVSTLIQAMKEFSHPGTKEKIPLDLNKALESTITIARNEWKYVAEMETDLDPSLPVVNCLPSELNQAVLNLIVNAAHAIEEVVGKNGYSKGKIRVQTRNQGDWVEIRISDTGCGIPEKVRCRIFDPFFTTKEVGKGTGQGLVITRNVIVNKHQGTIDFETQEGTGTTFIVRLPYQAQPATSAAHV